MRKRFVSVVPNGNGLTTLPVKAFGVRKFLIKNQWLSQMTVEFFK